MNIDEITVGQAKELAKMFAQSTSGTEDFPFSIGSVVLIRTVTMIQIGTIVAVSPNFILLDNGGWVADTGRFGECLANGTVNEFERAPAKFAVSRGAIVDVFPWPHVVPAESK